MSRPNKKKVAVDKAVLEAAKVLATKAPPPRTTTVPAPAVVPANGEPTSPGKQELKWQRGELREAKLIVKMAARLERNAANDFMLACQLFDARYRRWERGERRMPPPSGLSQLEKAYQIEQKQYLKAQLEFERAQGSTWEAREHEKDVQCKVHVLEIARLRRAMRRRRIVAGAK
jgi:hypothetical protein